MRSGHATMDRAVVLGSDHLGPGPTLPFIHCVTKGKLLYSSELAEYSSNNYIYLSLRVVEMF